MVGRLFGSPAHDGGGAPAPLNTPKSQSRKDRIEQARQDRSRRRNFGFLKTGTAERGMVSSNTLSKRREHAKQLANLAYSEDPTLASSSNSLTPTSRYAHQELLSSLDVESPQGTSRVPPLDPFSTGETRKQFSKRYHGGGGIVDSTTSLFLDAQRHLGPDREPTASTVDTFDTSSVGSAAFDMDFVAAAGKATAGLPSPISTSRATYYAGNSGAGGTGGAAGRRKDRSSNNNIVSLDHYFVESNDRNTISMPTIPSNSTMQASNNNYQRGMSSSATGSHMPTTTSNTQQQQQKQRQQQQQSYHQSSIGGSTNSTAGVAARRRMRSHMRNQSGSNSSVGSASSNQHHNHNNNDASSVDASFVSSVPSTPPESPASVRNVPVGSSSASKNRLATYQQQHRISTSSINNASNLSFYSTGGASVGSSSAASSSPNIFDSDKVDGGFTFDAFGLDESQVEREVNEAMQELAGQGIAGFSIFVDKTTTASGGGGTSTLRKDSFAVQSDDEFTPQMWDTSPMSSRNASPVPSTVANDGEDFVDGFRIKQRTAHGGPNGYGPTIGANTSNRHKSPSLFLDTSPNSSSALTEASKRRLQRSLSRGTTTGRNIITKSKYTSNQATLPRWGANVPAASASPQTASAAFKDSGVSNPWKEDPWASDDGANATGSDFGGQEETLSDVHDYRGSYGSGGAANLHIRGGRLSYSDAKSDIGVGPAAAVAVAAHRPMFYHLPPEEAPRQNDDDGDQTDNSDEMSQLQEDLAHEFAAEFVRRSVSRKSDHAVGGGEKSTSRDPTKRVLDYGENDESNEDYATGGIQASNFQAETPTRCRLRLDVGNEGQIQSLKSSAKPGERIDLGLRSRDQSEQSNQPFIRSEGVDQLDPENSSYTSSELVSQFTPSSQRRVVSKPTVHYSNDKNHAGNRQEQSERKAVYNLPNYGSLRSSYNVAKSQVNSETSTSGHESDQTGVSTRSQKHQPSDADNRIEEKKDDDDTALKSPQPKFGSLKERWEAKTRLQADVGAKIPHVEPKQIRKLENQGRLQALSTAIEMLTPEIVDARRVEKQKTRSEHLRKSLGVDTNSRVLSSKSDVRGSKYDSSVANRILDRIRKNSPPENNSPAARSDTQSDGGSTPSFLAKVKLRNVSGPASISPIEPGVGSPNAPVPTPSYRERKAWEPNDEASPTIEHVDHMVNQAAEKPLARNLTYRERREIELQREKDAKANLKSTTTDPPKKDVASLIRMRIAANKQKCSSAPKESPSNEGSSPLPIQLKPSEKENFSHGETRPNQMTTTPTLSQHSSALPNDASSNEVGQLVSSRIQQRSGSFQTSAIDDSHTPPSQDVQQRQISPKAGVSPKFGVYDSNPDSIVNFERETQRNDVPDNATLVGVNNLPKFFESPQKSPTKSSHRRPSPSLHAKFVDSIIETQERTNNEVLRPITPDVRQKVDIPDEVSAADVKSMLSSFLGNRAAPALPLPTKDDDTEALKKHHVNSPSNSPPAKEIDNVPPPPPSSYKSTGNRPPLKDDPKFERYFRMLKMGLPLEVAKHAMVRDGLDPSVLDLDHDKPIGVPLKEDPKFEKYFKMIKIGISMNQVKHAIERDGLDPDIMDQDHNLPVITVEKPLEKKSKETHRRARLHWRTIGNVVRNSLWAKVETEVDELDIDEEEFNELFKADLKDSTNASKAVNNSKKKGAAVRVIDAKRANNGGIILARLKMTHDEMADAVDRIDSDALSAEQIENIIEYLPTKEERDALEQYMLEGGHDAAEKFDGLCECEKFMVSMMTVKHAKRKIRALLFKLQFMSCMESIAEDARTIDNACDELSNSNRLRQLFGIILQFGNRLNTAGVNNKGKAGAFTLDSLLKLSQAKAFDKKTTFLHYIILIVQRNNEILLNYYDDLPTVLKADKVFWDQCLQDLEAVENQLENVRRISLYEARMKKQYQLQGGNKRDDDSLSEMELTLEEEVESLRATPTGLFTLGAIKQVSALRDKIERTKAKFERALEYFGEDTRKLQPHELFNIISAFTRDFQKAKEEVFSTVQKKLREERKKARSQTPNEKKALPPARPSASKPSAILRASEHQPNMSKLFDENKPRSASTLHPSWSKEASSPPIGAPLRSPPPKTKNVPANDEMLNSLTNGHSLRPAAGRSLATHPSTNSTLPISAYRSMQYQSEIPEERAPSKTSTPSNAAEAAYRQTEQKRDRYQEPFVEMRNGAGDVGSGRTTNVALAPQMRSANPTNTSISASAATGGGASASIRSPRDALRNRRRLEAMRSRYSTTSNAEAASGVDNGGPRAHHPWRDPGV